MGGGWLRNRKSFGKETQTIVSILLSSDEAQVGHCTAASLVRGIFFKNNDALPVEVIDINSDDVAENVNFVAVKLT